MENSRFVARYPKSVPPTQHQEDPMRTAVIRYCLSATLAIPALSRAAFEYSVRIESSPLFRTEALEPPPLANLAAGQAVRLIHHGAAQSLVETAGGMKGWMRNADLLALAPAPGGEHRLGEQDVFGGGELAVSPDSWVLPGSRGELLAPDRSFTAEIAEALDKEQVEMRHDEN
jgi:hypothetical protein